ncbi:unnamed protein product, partial [Ascophyllum nodosum]
MERRARETAPGETTPAPSARMATARQHGIQLEGELAPCSGCSMAKGS